MRNWLKARVPSGYERLTGRRPWEELRRLRELQWRPAAELEARALEKLRAIVSHAHAHVPYYRDLLRRAAVEPGEIRSITDLSRIPISRKADLRPDPTGRVLADKLPASVEAYFPYLHSGVRPLDGDRWIVEVYTHPSRRRRGLYAAATVAAMHRARERGHRRLIGLIAAWNASARRVAEELQRSVIGTVGYWTIGRWRQPLVRGRVRLDDQGRVFVPLEEDARPRAPVA